MGSGSGLAITHPYSRALSKADEPTGGQPSDLNCHATSTALPLRRAPDGAQQGGPAIVIPRAGRPRLIATCDLVDSARTCEAQRPRHGATLPSHCVIARPDPQSVTLNLLTLNLLNLTLNPVTQSCDPQSCSGNKVLANLNTEP